MNKSVFIMNQPKDCVECILNYDGVCLPNREPILEEEEGKRPFLEDCPLVKLPEKRLCNYYDFEHYQSGYDKGWNDMYEKIVKE